MSFKSGLGLTFAVTSILMTSGCGGKAQQISNLSTSPDEANQTLKARVARTLEIKKTLQSIENALKPVDSTLADVSRVMGAESTRLKKELPRFSITELRHAFRNMENGLVTEQKDGSWVAVQEITWPFERLDSSLTSCSTSTVKIVATDDRAASGNEDLKIYVKDCSIPEPTLFAQLHVDANGTVRGTFNSDFTSQIRNQVVQSKSCALVLNVVDSEASLECDPFTATVQGVSLSFEQFSYQHIRAGDSMHLEIQAYNGAGTKVGAVRVEQQTGQSVSIKRLD